MPLTTDDTLAPGATAITQPAKAAAGHPRAAFAVQGCGHDHDQLIDGGSNESSGGMKVSFVDAGSAWLALVQPVGEGPSLDYVRKKMATGLSPS